MLDKIDIGAVENLAFENKNMAEALEGIGCTKQQIDDICQGTLDLKDVLLDHTKITLGTRVTKSDMEPELKDYSDICTTRCPMCESLENHLTSSESEDTRDIYVIICDTCDTKWVQVFDLVELDIQVGDTNKIEEIEG